MGALNLQERGVLSCEEQSGDDGADYLYGSYYDDILSGAAGDDHVYGWADSDSLYGGTEDDDIFGGGGGDYMSGGSGADSLYGEDSDDQLYGDAGCDPVLNGGPGSDTCYCAASNPPGGYWLSCESPGSEAAAFCGSCP